MRYGGRCGRDSYLVLRLRIDYPRIPHHDHRQTLLGLALLRVLGNVGVGGRERLRDPSISYIIALCKAFELLFCLIQARLMNVLSFESPSKLDLVKTVMREAPSPPFCIFRIILAVSETAD